MGILSGLIVLILVVFAGVMIFSIIMYIKQSIIIDTVESEKVSVDSPKKSNLTCMKCGYVLLGQYTFCPFCGNKQDNPNEQNEVNVSENYINNIETGFAGENKIEVENVETSIGIDLDNSLPIDPSNGEKIESDEVIKVDDVIEGNDVNNFENTDLLGNNELTINENNSSILEIHQNTDNLSYGELEKVEDIVPTHKQQIDLKNKPNNKRQKRRK